MQGAKKTGQKPALLAEKKRRRTSGGLKTIEERELSGKST